MANIKFFKKATRPTSAGVGSVWFDSTRKAIVLTGATAAEDVIYSGCITNAVVDGEKLILTKTDGTNIEVDFAVFATDAALNSGLAKKVDKVEGKGLSTNDFTTAEKNKLAGIAAGANAYSLPIASATVLGGIKVGNNLTISNDGVLSGVADTHYANTFTIKGAGTTAATFDQSSDATLNITAGTGISVSATSGTITIANTVANTHLKNFLDIQAAGTSVVKYTQDSDKTLKFVAGSNVTLTPNATNGTITISSTDTNTDTKVTSVENHYTPSGGTAKTNGNVLTSVTCDAAGHVTSVGGRNDIPASWLTGTIDIARLPAGALERLFVVADEAAAMKANVQEGDTVKVTGNNNKMYFCVKSPSAGDAFATCFTEYTAGSATSVPWSGVTDKPSTFTPSAHTHDDRYFTKTEINTKLNDKVDNSSTGADSLLSKLTTTWDTNPTDNTYFIRQDVGGTNTFGRVKFSTLWSYIREKTGPIYATKRHSHTKNDIDDFPTIPTVNDPKVSIKMNGAEKGSFTLNQASAGEVDLGTVLTAHQDISGKVDKTTLLNTLMVVDLSSADIAVRKAALDDFKAKWLALGNTDLTGARFIGRFSDANGNTSIYENGKNLIGEDTLLIYKQISPAFPTGFYGLSYMKDMANSLCGLYQIYVDYDTTNNPGNVEITQIRDSETFDWLNRFVYIEAPSTYLKITDAESTYAKKTSIPTVNDNKLTINLNGVKKAEFTANSARDVICNLTDTTYSAGSGLALSGTTFNLVWEEYE